MRWVGGRRSDLAVGDLEELTRELELAAAEAPPSPRVDEVRMRLLASLDEVDAGGRPMARVMIAAVVVLLLAIVVAVGAPAVGSYLDSLFEDATPAPTVPSPTPEPASRAEPEPRVSRVPPGGGEPTAWPVEPGAAVDAPPIPGRAAGEWSPRDGLAPVPTPAPTPTLLPWPPADPPVDVPSPPVQPPVPPSAAPPITPGP